MTTEKNYTTKHDSTVTIKRKNGILDRYDVEVDLYAHMARINFGHDLQLSDGDTIWINSVVHIAGVEKTDEMRGVTSIEDVALFMYSGEPCRICGREITYRDVKNGAVYVGYNEDNTSRSAHKRCFFGYLDVFESSLPAIYHEVYGEFLEEEE